jgi:alginate O-acetyltransferase complex protein AlgI
MEVALPIGVSFYTFQTLTYSIDIYRGVRKPLNKVTDYLLYIMMFPQMIAGPIVRFNTIAEQITSRIVVSSDVLIGFYRFVIGLSKKVLIANVMGSKADEIMSMDFSSLDSTTAWIGILAYTFQIYFDFAGYSDMAIGIGRMLGFTFPENFNNPYVSKNITEFWRRWHITLGTWMKDYLYIPLGGNKVNSKTRLFFNLWIVFFISGLWHGAAWNFVLWGVFHGTFLILDRLFLIQILNKSGQILSVIFTFFITILGWVIFRIEDFSMAKAFYKKLFRFDFNPIEYGLNNNYFFTILLIAILFSFITISKRGRQLEEYIYFKDYNSYIKTCTMFIIVLTLLMLSIASITSSEFNPFIYFRF